MVDRSVEWANSLACSCYGGDDNAVKRLRDLAAEVYRDADAVGKASYLKHVLGMHYFSNAVALFCSCTMTTAEEEQVIDLFCKRSPDNVFNTVTIPPAQ